MDSFERELTRIGKELAEEYLRDKTIKQMVKKNRNNLGDIIQKDIEETLVMTQGDLEFSCASFYRKKPSILYAKLSIAPTLLTDFDQTKTFFFEVIPLLLRSYRYRIEEMSYKIQPEAWEPLPRIKIYAARETNEKKGRDEIRIDFEYDTECDVSGAKLKIEYPYGAELYVKNIANCLGAKIGPLQISQKE